MFAPPPRPSRSLISAAIVIAFLYFGRAVLIPVALAVLFGFLLAPAVTRLERWHIRRIPAVAIVLIVVFSVIGEMGWLVTNQLVTVITELPNYRVNIRRRIELLRNPKAGGLSRATDSLKEVSKELSDTQTKAPAPGTSALANRDPIAATPAKPVPVEVVGSPPDALKFLGNPLGSFLGPLTTGGLVIIFTIFMLINREDLRNRFIRLAGQGELNVMTQVLNEAGSRVSQYLLMQAIVNVTYGVFVSLGLYFIGVPYPLLWGTLVALSRFVPYVGTLIVGALPVVFAFAVFSGWREPLLTLSLIVVVEVVVANLIEPYLYGAHTGISSLAILVASVFWAVLWGPVGIILATPLTACLVVLGRYIPHLEFFTLVLGDAPVLPIEARFYQRLLAMDYEEARELADAYCKEHSRVELYDSVLIPALNLAERDRHRNILDRATEEFMFQSLKELMEELGDAQEKQLYPGANGYNPTAAGTGLPGVSIVCLPARDVADEITAAMFTQLAELAGYPARSLAVGTPSSEICELISQQDNTLICVSALPPFSVMNARSICAKLRARFPKLEIIAGLWTPSADSGKTEERVRAIFANRVPVTVATTFKEALQRVSAIADSVPVKEAMPSRRKD